MVGAANSWYELLEKRMTYVAIEKHMQEAQDDYLKAVIAERDALKLENAGWKADQKENLRNQVELQQEVNALRKAAQMALDTLQYLYSDMTDHETIL